MRRTLDAARDNRLWDKRAAAYEVALAELANRQFGRERAGRRLEQDPRVMPEGFAEYFATYNTPAWFEAEGRLLAYSSQKVGDALRAVRSAEVAAAETFDCLGQTVNEAEEARGCDTSLPAQEAYVMKVVPAYNQLVMALNDCSKCDLALIDLIRAEAAVRRPPPGARNRPDQDRAGNRGQRRDRGRIRRQAVPGWRERPVPLIANRGPERVPLTPGKETDTVR